MEYEFREIDRSETLPFIKNIHYAQRVPSISFSYGVFLESELIGVVTYGKPASNSLCEGVCGKEFKSQVYELNRLVFKRPIKNLASMLIGFSLRKLKELNLIIVSYADLGQNHNGYVYQAANFIYTGQTKERTDKYVPLGKHSRHYTNGETDHLRVIRSSKLRYVYFAADKKHRELYKNNLKYEILPYPKYKSEHYILGTRQKRRVINKESGTVILE